LSFFCGLVGLGVSGEGADIEALHEPMFVFRGGNEEDNAGEVDKGMDVTLLIEADEVVSNAGREDELPLVYNFTQLVLRIH
jgi:hypothetical protein